MILDFNNLPFFSDDEDGNRYGVSDKLVMSINYYSYLKSIVKKEHYKELHVVISEDNFKDLINSIDGIPPFLFPNKGLSVIQFCNAYLTYSEGLTNQIIITSN